MEPAHESTARFRRRWRGYDRREVEQALASASEALRRARARCDELATSATNVERIGAEVADMIRALAERAVELEDEAAANAERTIHEAQVEADGIRAEAAAVLVDAQRQRDAVLAEFEQRQAMASTRRQTAVAALHVAMDQLRRLTGSIEEMGPDVLAGDVLGDEDDSSATASTHHESGRSDWGGSSNVIVLAAGDTDASADASADASTDATTDAAPEPEGAFVDNEAAIAAAMARISKLTRSNS